MLIDFKHRSGKVPKIGQLVLSEPFMQDTFFERTVILICEYNNGGVTGIVLNKPSDMEYAFKKGNTILKIPIYTGGIVNKNQLFYVHSQGNIIPNSIKITDDIYWGYEFNHFDQLIQENRLNPKYIRLFFGYAGWSVDQLKGEMNNNNWIICDETHKATIFDNDTDSLWHDILFSMGGEYKFYSNVPENPSLN